MAASSTPESNDIRICNACAQRSPDARMHFCAGCMNFICTRAACMDKHTQRCGRALAPPMLCVRDMGQKHRKPESQMQLDHAANYNVNGFDVEYHKRAVERKGRL